MTWKSIKGAVYKQLDEEAFYVEKSLNGWLRTARVSGETEARTFLPTVVREAGIPWQSDFL